MGASLFLCVCLRLSLHADLSTVCSDCTNVNYLVKAVSTPGSTLRLFFRINTRDVQPLTFFALAITASSLPTGRQSSQYVGSAATGNRA